MPRPKLEIDREILKKAIKGTHGYMIRICRNVERMTEREYDVTTVERRINEDTLEALSPAERKKEQYTLAEYVKQERKSWTQQITARAEDGLAQAVNNNEQWAIRYALNNLGKEYGYEQTATLQLENTDPLNITLTGEMESAESLAESSMVEIGNAEEAGTD